MKTWFERVVFAVDSGAVTTVIPKGAVKFVPLEATPESRSGQYFSAANGGRVYNLGRRILRGLLGTATGPMRGIKATVTEVTKALLSVADLVDTGHTVIFSRSGSRAVHDETGEVTEFTRRRNTFEVTLLAPRPTTRLNRWTRTASTEDTPMTTVSSSSMEVDRAKPWRRRRNAKMDVDVVASADDLFADEPPPEAPRAEETGGPGPDPGPCVVCQEVPLVKTVRAPEEPTKKERDDHAALRQLFDYNTGYR